MSTRSNHAPYCLLPRRMLSDLRDNPLAIGLYALVARLFLVSHAPVPLSRADVLRYDPSLKTGAVKRALDRLLANGWLTTSVTSGSPKHHYTPAWGRIGGSVRPWCLDAPCLGRPRHLATLHVNRDLLDIGLGRLAPHPRHAAEVTRYLEVPALSLADLGVYALVTAGLDHTTPTLTVLGLVEAGQIMAPPPASELVQQFARRSGIELSEQGRRKLERAPATTQNQIGRPIGGVIGQLIGSSPARERLVSASGTLELPQRLPRPITPGILRDSSESKTPPPSPAPSGGGWRVLCGGMAERPKPATVPVPETEATQLLSTIAVRPAQQRELASMPLAAVEQAIADGQARPGVRDLAGWVVYLLRQRRDSDWTPLPPAPRADAPENLRLAFARYAAAQEAERRAGMPEDAPWFVTEPAKLNLPATLPKLWNEVQAALKGQLPRAEFALVRHATLQSVEAGLATIQAPNQTVKAALEDRHLSMLRDLIGLHVDEAVDVRVTLNPHAPAPKATALDDPQLPTPNSEPPAWIAAERWAELPVMLRAALVGSQLVDGEVRGREPFVTRLLETRHRHEVDALLAEVG